jgi:hypothetical protein
MLTLEGHHEVLNAVVECPECPALIYRGLPPDKIFFPPPPKPIEKEILGSKSMCESVCEFGSKMCQNLKKEAKTC